MKLPVKDRTTIPYMTNREIPAIKAALSAWRRLRRDKVAVAFWRNAVRTISDPESAAIVAADEIGWKLVKLAAIEERMRKEARNA